MDALFREALLAGVGVALLAGMLGPFVIWRRMSYMGDAMGHAALLGVVFGLLLGFDPSTFVWLVAVGMGILLNFLQRDKRLPFDALLGVAATGALAGGLALYSRLPNRQVDLYSYLFGDILAVSHHDLQLLFVVLVVQSVLIAKFWRPLLRMMLHEPIARVEGVPVPALQLLITVLVALTVAMALQIVGLLLISALLVIPPLTARLMAKTPHGMVLISMATGVLAAAGGVTGSWHYDIPTGPCIVLFAVALFLLAWMLGGFGTKGRHHA